MKSFIHIEKGWMKHLLMISGIYQILWGIGLILFSPTLTIFFGFSPGEISLTFQFLGFILLSLGIGLVAGSDNPLINWPFILSIFLLHLLATIFFSFKWLFSEMSSRFAATVIVNHAIWILPFGWLLLKSFDYNRMFSERLNYLTGIRFPIGELDILTNKGLTIRQLSENRPVLLVFLRHFGCTFCREALSTLSVERKKIDKMGTEVILVHMVDDSTAEKELSHLGLNDLHRISDPNRDLYRNFELEHGNLIQLLGPKVMLRGFMAGVLNGNGIGGLKGDARQMPGVFLVYKNEIVKAFRHQTASDTPDYTFLARCESC